jgi:hypothetical protein
MHSGNYRNLQQVRREFAHTAPPLQEGGERGSAGGGERPGHSSGDVAEVLGVREGECPSQVAEYGPGQSCKYLQQAETRVVGRCLLVFNVKFEMF